MCTENKIYEILDTSDPEGYLVLNLFRTLSEAKVWLNTTDEREPFTEHGVDDELEEITIREREFEVFGEGKVVFTLSRTAYYKEEEDCLYWKSVEETF